MKKLKDLPYCFGLKMQAYPSSTQKRIIDKNINFSRFYWNQLVSANKKAAGLKHAKSFSWPWADNQLAHLRELANPNCKLLKQLNPFLNDAELDSDVPMQVKANYQAAWNLCKKVKSVQPPKFHKKHENGSYQTSNHYNGKKIAVASPYNGNIRFLDEHHIFLSKVGRIRTAFSPKLYFRIAQMVQNGGEVRLTKAKVSRDACGDYFVSFQFASDVPYAATFAKTGSSIGIDLNLDNFLTDSNGDVIDNPRFYRQARTQLAKAQRKLGKRCARAKKEHRTLRLANNYQKQRKLVSRIHRRILRRRDSFLNELSTTLIKNHDLVAAEELRSKNLLKNHALAMSISDAGWRTFLSMLEYKAEMHGKTFRAVDPKNTTQTCSHCGHVLDKEHKLTLKDREWKCPVCGTFHIRDHNAAKNILAKALA